MIDKELVTIVNQIADMVRSDGGSFCRCSPVEHLMKIRCREDALYEIRSDKNITSRFELNIKRINRWWWSVAFIDKLKQED